MDPRALHLELAHALRARRGADGGFALAEDGPSEVEPTALAALALDDDRARAWLRGRQRDDGGFDGSGVPELPTVSELAALALGPGARAERALRYAISNRSLPLPNAPDPNRPEAWGWTDDARSLVEPTSRVLIGVKALRPDDRATREEALGLLSSRRCADGGWNFGNASVFGVDLRGYAQTTAFALVALQGEGATVIGPGLAFLRRGWRDEPGGLSFAQATVAFRLHGQPAEAAATRAALAEVSHRRSFLGRTITLAWAVLATAPDAVLDRLRPAA